MPAQYLCWDGLLDEFLNNGALVRVTADSVPSTRGYFVTHRTGIEPDSAIRAASKWLRQNAVGARPAAPMGNSAATAAVEE